MKGKKEKYCFCPKYTAQGPPQASALKGKYVKTQVLTLRQTGACVVQRLVTAPGQQSRRLAVACGASVSGPGPAVTLRGPSPRFA